MVDEMFQNLGPKDEGSVAAGFSLGFGPGLVINFFSGCASVNFSQELRPTLVAMFIGIAIGQLLFTLPFYRYLKGRGRDNTVRGLIIGASIACLIGVTCGVSLRS